LNDQVSKALEGLLSDKNPFLVDASFRALEKWVTRDSVPGLINLTKTDAGKKGKVVKLVTKFPDHERVPPFLVSLLPDAFQRDTAGKALIAMGTRGEKAILDVKDALPLERDVNARRAAYQILGAVGTKASLAPLAALIQFETVRGDKTNATVAK